jgi:hypothetical protein
MLILTRGGNMPRELLKFREGDCGLKIKKDGTLEVAGVDDSGGMINKEGRVNPALLFAAAWARKEPKVFEALVQNFKDAVAEGFFGPEAQADYKRALDAQAEHTKSLQDQNVAVKDVPFMKPDETAEYGNEFETHSDKPTVSAAASGAVTFEQPKPGATTWPGQDKPTPMTVEEQLDRRDGNEDK